MTESNIVLEALKQAVKAAGKLKIDYCLFGGLAMQAYKRIRATMDVDLMVAVDKDRIPDLIFQLESEGLKFDRKRGIVKISGFDLLRFIYTDKRYMLEIFVDIAAANTNFQKQILSRKQRLDFFGIKINIASCEDLILLKVLSGRPIDKLDAQVLIQENLKYIDKSYLTSQARELGTDRSLRTGSKRAANFSPSPLLLPLLYGILIW